MQLTNTAHRYGAITKTLYWAIFLMVLFEFVVGFGIMFAEKDEPVLGYARSGVISTHATVGILILVFAGVRLWWRTTRPLPDWAPGLSRREQRISHRNEQILYAMMFAKPLTGLWLIMSRGRDVYFFGAVRIPNLVGGSEAMQDIALLFHMVTGIVLLGAFALHFGIGLKHHLVDRDRQLNRMLPFTHQ